MIESKSSTAPFESQSHLIAYNVESYLHLWSLIIYVKTASYTSEGTYIPYALFVKVNV